MLQKQKGPETTAIVAGPEGISPEKCKPFKPKSSCPQVDPRLAILLRASARFELFDAGHISLEDAWDAIFEAVCCACPHRGGRQ